MTALRVRCWGVMTSELYMDHLLEDGRELGADVGLECGTERVPDGAGVVRHNTSHCSASLDSHEGLSTKIELTCATSIRRQDAGSCWRAKESAGTLCQNRPRAGEDDGRVFETGQSLPSRSDRWRRSRQ